MASKFRKIGITTIGVCAGITLTAWGLQENKKSPYLVSQTILLFNHFTKCIKKINDQVHLEAEKPVRRKRTPLPSRLEQVKKLQNESEEYDILIIGGGATGAGCALDSVTRGLKTALVEADDFASGTSSRSTKLIHGGVRYLQKAILGADIEQYNMVKEALHERASMLNAAPHLTRPLPIMLPVYQ